MLKKGIYLIRLDDACPYMDRAKWNRMESILDKYGVKPLVGIIPANADPMTMIESEDAEFWDWALKWGKKGWSMALHGYDHVCISDGGMNGLNPIWSRSEFAGVPLEVQKQKIRDGFEILVEHGLKPEYFFAPSHTYDENTLIALKECSNIRIVSDTFATKPYKAHGLTFVPCQMGRLRAMLIKGCWCACYHPNAMTEADFVILEQFLAGHRDAFASFADLAVKRRSFLDKAAAFLYYTFRRLKR